MSTAPTPKTPAIPPAVKSAVQALIIMSMAAQLIWALGVWQLGGWLMTEGIAGYAVPCWWGGLCMRSTVLVIGCKAALEHVASHLNNGAT